MGLILPQTKDNKTAFWTRFWKDLSVRIIKINTKFQRFARTLFYTCKLESIRLILKRFDGFTNFILNHKNKILRLQQKLTILTKTNKISQMVNAIICKKLFFTLANCATAWSWAVNHIIVSLVPFVIELNIVQVNKKKLTFML